MRRAGAAAARLSGGRAARYARTKDRSNPLGGPVSAFSPPGCRTVACRPVVSILRDRDDSSRYLGLTGFGKNPRKRVRGPQEGYDHFGAVLPPPAPQSPGHFERSPARARKAVFGSPQKSGGWQPSAGRTPTMAAAPRWHSTICRSGMPRSLKSWRTNIQSATTSISQVRAVADFSTSSSALATTSSGVTATATQPAADLTNRESQSEAQYQQSVHRRRTVQ